MRHWYIYIILYAIVGVFGLSPFRGNDIATLSPVEAVWLEAEHGNVRIETDGGDIGVGETVLAALDNMKETASATVFLDTADFLIVKTGSEALIEQLREILRPSCSLCVAETMPDLKQTAAFLSMHEPSFKMKNSYAGVGELPLLQEQKGRLILIEKDDTDHAVNSVADRCGERTNLELFKFNRLDYGGVCCGNFYIDRCN